MFRIGGSVNEGIISIAQPRKNYQTGTEYTTRIAELKPIFREALGPSRSERDRFLDMLLRGSIRLASERPIGGGIIPTIAKSFQEPVEQYLKSGETEEALQRQIDLAAITSGISSVDAERLAKIKYNMEAGKEQEQRKKELMQQYQINYTEADAFQNFLNQANTIGRTAGVPVASAPLFLTFKKGKYEVAGAKNMPEGIYYDPRSNKYIKIKSGTPTIGDSIKDVIKPENQVISQQSYRDYINEELKKRQREKIESKGYTSFDSSSP
jgi:hypothetical protein